MALKYKTQQKTDIKKLEQLQRNVCRQFQCLPERTSYIAVYALTGAEPIEVTLDKYCINLFFGISRLDSTIEKQMLLWESPYANANDTLFINKIAGILEKYGMHTPMKLLINPPSKHMGETMIRDRPFNLQVGRGGYVFCLVQNFFSDDTRVRNDHLT